MPPSHHSSSSHSSHSHSSHSRSHSSSSHSSSSRSFSSHSSSSSYSRPTVNAINRKRTYQPKGYSRSGKPIYYYCKNHNYIYYPESWMYDGIHYERGYYDENGLHYNNVAFKQNGVTYAELECEYCNNRAKIEWKDGFLPVCPNCGSQMQITGTIDEQVAQPSEYALTNSKSFILKILILVFYILGLFAIFVLFALKLISIVFFTEDNNINRAVPNEVVSNIDIYGSELYLSEDDNGIYVISDENDYDKLLTWDYGAESYYDPESDCYVWYNTDVAPNLWQYWYEDISADYGDYGWMEYESDSWFIEVSNGYWIDLPSKYDTSSLWHIKNAFDTSKDTKEDDKSSKKVDENGEMFIIDETPESETNVNIDSNEDKEVIPIDFDIEDANNMADSGYVVRYLTLGIPEDCDFVIDDNIDYICKSAFINIMESNEDPDITLSGICDFGETSITLLCTVENIESSQEADDKMNSQLENYEKAWFESIGYNQ